MPFTLDSQARVRKYVIKLKEVALHIEFLFPCLRMAIQERWDSNSLSLCLENQEEPTKTRLLAFQAMPMEKSHQKGWHDNKVKHKDMVEGSMALIFF